MIELLLKATIMAIAASMAVALWRSRHDRLGKIGRAGDIAFYGAIFISAAKFIDVVAILALQRSSASPLVIKYADLLATAIVTLGIVLFAASLLRWIDAGRCLSSTTDLAVKRGERLQKGYNERGLALSTVPAILYRGRGAIGDKNARYEFLNDKIREILGHAPETLENDPAFMLRIMHPEDRRHYGEGEYLEVVMRPRSVLEHRFLHENGEYRWIRRHITRVNDEHGEFKELVGCAFDITDLKDAETRLQNFLDSAPDAVVTVDKDGLIALASTRATHMFGRPREELIGQHYTVLVPEQDGTNHAELLATDAECAANCEGCPNTELDAVRKDGTTFPVEINVSEIQGVDSQFVALAIRDITLRRETQARLHQAQKMEAVGQLTGGIAHDFNNMLSVIIGNLQMLKQSDIGDRCRQYIESAMGGAERATDLTNRLLAFSRQQVLAPKVVEINKLVHGIEFLLRHTLGREISLETSLADDLWRVRIDPGELENALVNLAINARDALDDGGRLLIETSNKVIDERDVTQNDLAPGDYVQVKICDNGTGIADDVLPHIFDPFYTTKEIGKGTGLGLSMVYGFVKQSRGHIKVDSSPDAGTAMTVYLPRYVATSAETADGGSGQTGASNRNERILVVEDNKAIREIVGRQLKSLDYEVLQAASGPSALELLNGDAADIDLLFTDLEMPGGMTGIELAAVMRQRNPNLRVLYTSGHSSTGLVDSELLSPDDIVLSKPYPKETLAQSVRGVLG